MIADLCIKSICIYVYKKTLYMKIMSSRQQKFSSSCIPVPYNVNRTNHRQSLLAFLGYFFPQRCEVSGGCNGYEGCSEPPAAMAPSTQVSPNSLFLYSKRIQMSDQFILPHSLFVIVDLNVLVLLTILHSWSYLKSTYVAAFSFCSAKAA